MATYSWNHSNSFATSSNRNKLFVFSKITTLGFRIPDSIEPNFNTDSIASFNTLKTFVVVLIPLSTKDLLKLFI